MKKKLDISLDELLDEINLISPVDTGNYKAHNKKIGITSTNTQLIGIIANDSDIAERVEFGFRSTGVTWHPETGPVYRDKNSFLGARVYTRAVDKLRGQIIRNLNK